MPFVIIFLSIFVIVCLILIFCISTNNAFKEDIIRLNEAEANIEAVLRKRYDWLNKSVEIIKTVTEKDDVMQTIVQLRSKKLSNLELDTQLYDVIDEFKGYLRDYEKLKDEDGYMKVEMNLLESEAEIVALRKYYNDIARKYNKMARSFPTNLVATLKKHKRKEYYEEREKKDFLEEFKS